MAKTVFVPQRQTKTAQWALLPLPVRSERGEGHNTLLTCHSSLAKCPSSPQPSPPSKGGEGEASGALNKYKTLGYCQPSRWDDQLADKAVRAPVGGFGLPDLLVVLAIVAVLVTIVVPVMARNGAKNRHARCASNLKEITRAVLLYADDFSGTLPQTSVNQQSGLWWMYKELVKGRLGLTG